MGIIDHAGARSVGLKAHYVYVPSVVRMLLTSSRRCRDAGAMLLAFRRAIGDGTGGCIADTTLIHPGPGGLARRLIVVAAIVSKADRRDESHESRCQKGGLDVHCINPRNAVEAADFQQETSAPSVGPSSSFAVLMNSFSDHFRLQPNANTFGTL